MNCPKCYTELRRFKAWEPGQMAVCQACGVILRVNDSYAALPATPPEIDALPPALFTGILSASCAAQRRKISARSGKPVEVHKTASGVMSAVERPARSGLLERVK